MRTIVEAAGVDYPQWLALTRALLKSDLRMRSFGHNRMGRQSQGVRALAGQAVIYGLYGLVLSFFVWASRDLFLVGVVLTTLVMFVVGTAILLDHAGTLAATGDYAILGFRPVTSRTYLAVRLTNILIYTTVMTTLLAWVPLTALVMRHGVAVGLAGIAAVYGSSTTAALGLLLAYTALLRVVRADALKQALGYTQFVMGFAVYGGYLLMSRALRSAAATLVLPKTVWVLLLPPAWFASYLELARGARTLAEWVPAGASAILIGGIVWAFSGKVSTEFGGRIADLSAAAAPASRRAGRHTRAGWWFRSGEQRAMALLVRSQFRNDQRFRLGVLAILPMTLLYLFLGLRHGHLNDPFDATGSGADTMFIAFAVMIFPTMLKMHLTRSDKFRASWIFFVSPTSRARLIRASMAVVVVFFLLPYLVFVTGVLLWTIPHVWHILGYVLVLGLLSHLVLQGTVLLEPDLPFAKPPVTGRNSKAMFGLIIVLFVINGLMQAFGPRLFRSPLAFAALLAGLVLVGVFVGLLARTRIDDQARRLEFEG
jgi:ABC-2 type transport system permease protein